MSDPTADCELEPGPECLPGLFAFEADLYPSLHCIPMRVRYKLDVVGLKLPLKAWNRLPAPQREALFRACPVDTAEQVAAVREELRRWVAAVFEEPLKSVTLPEVPEWEETSRLPEAVAGIASVCDPPFALEEWVSLEPLKRFALVKLAGSRHERERFPNAVAEFRRAR